jgi:hypothetical protein
MGGITSDVAADGVPSADVTVDRERPLATFDDWKKAAEPLTTIIAAYKDSPAAGTVALGAFLVLKGCVLARGDISTALGILENAGLPTIVIGGLLSGLPILIAVTLAGSIFNAVTRKHEHEICVKRGVPLSPLAVVVMVTIALSLIVTPWPFMVFATTVGLGIGLVHRLDKTPLTNAAFAVAFICAVYAVSTMLYTVWLPREKLTIAHDSQPTIGYVLSDSPDGWTTILLGRQHSIVSYRDSDVISRQTCEVAPYSTWSDITDAATVWQEITKWSPLRFLHPTTEPPC